MKNMLFKTLAAAIALSVIMAYFSLTAAAVTSANYTPTSCQSITIKTGSGLSTPSVTFKATSDIYGYSPKLLLTVNPAVNGKTVYYVQGYFNTVTSTLKLDKNKTYTVTVKVAPWNASPISPYSTSGKWWISDTNNVARYY